MKQPLVDLSNDADLGSTTRQPVAGVRLDDESEQSDPLSPSFPEFKRPRPKLLRMCHLNWTCNEWPDQGKGVWLIEGFENLGDREERLLLRRVMPSEPGGPTGERIKFWRFSYEHGGMTVWRKGSDLPDPAYAVPSTPAPPSRGQVDRPSTK